MLPMLALPVNGGNTVNRTQLSLLGLVVFSLAGVGAIATAADPPAAADDLWTRPLGPSADPPGPFARVRLPKVAFKGDQPHGAALSLPSGKAVVLYLDAMLGYAKKTKVFLCDLKNGSVVQQWEMDGPYFPFDFDADGKRILCRCDHNGTGKKDTAELWSLTAEGAITRKRWVPYADALPSDRDLLWAAFVGDGRLATLGSGGQLIVWDPSTLKPLHTVTASKAFPAVSPNRGYVAFLRDGGVGLLDVAGGTVSSLLPVGDVQSASLAFRSDGQALLCAAKDKVVLIDPATRRAQSVSVPGVKGHSLHPLPSVGWADDRLLFVNDDLVDPEIPVPVWKYMGGVWARPAGGQVWFLAVKGMTDVGLVPVRLPQGAAVKKIVAARGDNSTFLLKPGDSVQVDVRQVPPEQQPTATLALEKVLRATEYQPSAKSALVLDVVPLPERTEARTYTLYRLWTFGAPAGDNTERKETYRFRVQPVDVRLLKDGHVIWDKRSQVTPGPPSSVSLTNNESLADKLAPFSVTDYGLLAKLELPKFLQEQLGRGVTRMSLGHSSVGPDGLDESMSRHDELMEKLESLKKDRADPSKKSLPKRTKL
jgi:hypothetical protein